MALEKKMNSCQSNNFSLSSTKVSQRACCCALPFSPGTKPVISVSVGKRNKPVICFADLPHQHRTGFLPTCTDILRHPPRGAGAHWCDLWAALTVPSHPSLTCLLVQLHVKLFVVSKKGIFQEDKQCLDVQHCAAWVLEEQKLYRSGLQIWKS